jgi:tripartite-type tricarboxylate transporter receptor subunit TctC
MGRHNLLDLLPLALLCALSPALCAAAQVYPSKPIRFIVPFAPGGTNDIVARIVGAQLGESWGQPVVVDNRGGAGGVAGVTIVAKQSAADGYTMLLGSVGHLSFLPAVRTNLGYDAQKDLAPISLAAVQPFVVAATLSLPGNSIKDLVSLARSKPGTVSYGSGGSGSASHLGIELLQHTAGVKMLHVPYKGSNPAITALMGSEIQIALAGLATVLPHAKSGRLKALAVTGAKRAQIASEVPTVAESGVPGYQFDVWYGLVFPGGTPRAIVQKTNTEVVGLLAHPDVSTRFASAGVEPQTTTPEGFRDLMAKEATTWRKVVKDANIRVE